MRRLQPVNDGVRGMIIDRIEGVLAVVEVAKGETRDIPLDRIDGRARDGAVLVERNDRYAVDEKATAERRTRTAEKRGRLFE